MCNQVSILINKYSPIKKNNFFEFITLSKYPDVVCVLFCCFSEITKKLDYLRILKPFRKQKLNQI